MPKLEFGAALISFALAVFVSLEGRRIRMVAGENLFLCAQTDGTCQSHFEGVVHRGDYLMLGGCLGLCSLSSA